MMPVGTEFDSWVQVFTLGLTIGPHNSESKESTRPLVFTSTKWARMSDFSDMVVQQDEW